jgi:hypothetical protein
MSEPKVMTLGITEWIQTARDHDPIIAAQDPIQFMVVFFRKLAWHL